MKGSIRKITPEDVSYIAEYAREADKKECYLLGGRTLQESFEQTERLYEDSYVWVVEDKIICAYGVVPHNDKVGAIWLLATDDFEKYCYTFKKECKNIFKNLISGYKYLYNYVHYKHNKAINWLEWLGCDIMKPEPIGVDGELFCKFEVRNV
jgi:hypothetical protein